ncbi:MAG: hypothetical protein A2231_12830 [Candidatus Firestonebacteria bacterium RIFOXYA2_FULL_40_8]|nr:MAG: hypothetical protein A2231_12830 [Candidatus Firestonebacteria bacterium RIFOXYA2_FULL_40_8]
MKHIGIKNVLSWSIFGVGICILNVLLYAVWSSNGMDAEGGAFLALMIFPVVVSLLSFNQMVSGSVFIAIIMSLLYAVVPALMGLMYYKIFKRKFDDLHSSYLKRCVKFVLATVLINFIFNSLPLLIMMLSTGEYKFGLMYLIKGIIINGLAGALIGSTYIVFKKISENRKRVK